MSSVLVGRASNYYSENSDFIRIMSLCNLEVVNWSPTLGAICLFGVSSGIAYFD